MRVNGIFLLIVVFCQRGWCTCYAFGANYMFYDGSKLIGDYVSHYLPTTVVTQ